MVYIIKIFNCRTQTETYKHFSKGILCSQLLILPIKISKKNSKKRNFQRTPPEKKKLDFLLQKALFVAVG